MNCQSVGIDKDKNLPSSFLCANVSANCYSSLINPDNFVRIFFSNFQRSIFTITVGYDYFVLPVVGLIS